MRLIDADVLLSDSEIKENFDSPGASYIKLIVKEQPTVDPVKHGYWTVKERTPTIYGCSVCGSYEFQSREYCPHCGAKMDADRPPKGKWRLLNGKWMCSECDNKVEWPLKICNNCEREMEIEI